MASGLFDPFKLPSRSRRSPQAPGGEAAAAGPITVSALVARIKGALAAGVGGQLTVVGELSNVKLHTSGHIYFSLKDSQACIGAAMFRAAASGLKFTPSDGLEVVVEGRVDVYDARGQLQLYVERMTPRGQGSLELAFRQMRQKLQSQGLFDPQHKLPLPRFPRAIGVITSRTGAAIRDIRRTLSRRWPGAAVYLLPVLVQGPGAAADVADAVARLDQAAPGLGIDTIIVARGGGSLEDLWAFNEEAVARAVFACRTPIISGVGHEVDVTICDLVADVRAATPTAAAELAVPDAAEVSRAVAALGERLRTGISGLAARCRLALQSCLRSVVFRDPLNRLRSRVQYIDELAHRLPAGLRHRLSRAREHLEAPSAALAAAHPAGAVQRGRAALAAAQAALRWSLGARAKRAGDALASAGARLASAHPRHALTLAGQRLQSVQRHLEALSYRSVLRRGYSVTRGPDGAILRSVSQARPGSRISTELADGRIQSDVAPAGADARPPRERRPSKAPPDGGPMLFDTPQTPNERQQ
jgi:exodeoxyribonuclease VII large subunit